METDKRFGSLDDTGKISYINIPFRIVKHHHDEWQQPKFNDAGEPEIDEHSGAQLSVTVANDQDEVYLRIHPTEEECNMMSCYAIVNDHPAEPGFYFTSTEYGDLVSNKIIRRYERHEIPAPPPIIPKYSKLKLITAAKSIEKWDALKSFISAAGYEDEWNACQFLAADHPQFEKAKEVIVSSGTLTEDEVNEILKQAEDPSII